jgi:hypothetical protein
MCLCLENDAEALNYEKSFFVCVFFNVVLFCCFCFLVFFQNHSKGRAHKGWRTSKMP